MKRIFCGLLFFYGFAPAGFAAEQTYHQQKYKAALAKLSEYRECLKTSACRNSNQLKTKAEEAGRAVAEFEFTVYQLETNGWPGLKPSDKRQVSKDRKNLYSKAVQVFKGGKAQ